MTQTQTTGAPPATYPSPIAAAAAAPQSPAADAQPRATPPHWTVYVSIVLSLVTVIGSSLVGYEVHSAHTDDKQSQISDTLRDDHETLKDHETRLRATEQLPGRIKAVEDSQKRVEDGQTRTEGKVDQLLLRLK